MRLFLLLIVLVADLARAGMTTDSSTFCTPLRTPSDQKRPRRDVWPREVRVVETVGNGMCSGGEEGRNRERGAESGMSDPSLTRVAANPFVILGDGGG